MKLHRFAMLQLNPIPRQSGVWESVGIGDHTVEIRLLQVHYDLNSHGKTPISDSTLIRATLNLPRLPPLDEQRRIVVPEDLREACELAIEHTANMISVLGAR